MATTQLTDVIEPSVFTDYVIERTAELSALFQSNIIIPDARIDALAKSPSTLVNMPFWNDLPTTESNISSDDPATLVTPQKITASQDIATNNYRNEAWSAADLVSAVAGADPMAAIGNLVASFWARDLQRTQIAMLRGVLADNIANDSSDMLYNIANDLATAITDAERISAEAVILAAQTMGDNAEKLTAIAMHSVPFSRLQIQDQIAFIRPSDNDIEIPTYLGKRVIVDDMLPAIAGTNRITYTTVLYGTGAMGYGEGAPRTPTEIDRSAAGGNGEGVETLHNRKHYILHPRGIKFTGSPAGQTPTNTEYTAAGSWDRVYERKNVRIAFLNTNG